MKRLLMATVALALLSACGNIAHQQTSPALDRIETTSKISEIFSEGVINKMAEHNLKGFSLVIFEDYKIVYSNQWGVKASTSPDLINQRTAFSTASMSKPITALLVAKLEEEGLIDLDNPVSGYLKRWPLPSNELTEKTAVTWRHLLSHTSGATQFRGYADFYEGDDIPTLVDSMNGKLPRYENIPLGIVFEPGTEWRYSGGGYSLIQMALEDHFDTSLSQLVQSYIFDPLDMRDTTLIQPNEPGFLSNIARVHDNQGDVIRNGLPITPQLAASGVWSTPTDMAKLAIAMQHALNGDASGAISPETAQKLTRVMSLKTSSGHSLFGPRSFGFNNTDWMIMGGSNTGVGGEVLASMNNGNGYVFFGNGDRPNRMPVFTHVRGQIFNLMKWETDVEFEVQREIPKTLKDAIMGRYKEFMYNEGGDVEIVEAAGKLYFSSPILSFFLGKEKSEMIYLGDNSFKVTDYPNILKFNLNDKNTLESLTLQRQGRKDLDVEISISDLQP